MDQVGDVEAEALLILELVDGVENPLAYCSAETLWDGSTYTE